MKESKEYLKQHKQSGIKVGDKVKVLKCAENLEKGWMNSWEDPMNNSIGKTLKVISDSGECGFELEDNMVNFEYPYFVLEKIEKTRKH